MKAHQVRSCYAQFIYTKGEPNKKKILLLFLFFKYLCFDIFLQYLSIFEEVDPKGVSTLKKEYLFGNILKGLEHLHLWGENLNNRDPNHLNCEAFQTFQNTFHQDHLLSCP